jgi:hypothetical protein
MLIVREQFYALNVFLFLDVLGVSIETNHLGWSHNNALHPLASAYFGDCAQTPRL